MKKLLSLLVLFGLFANSSFAYTEREGKEISYEESYEYFKSNNFCDYAKLSNWERRGHFVQSSAKAAASCVSSAGYSVFINTLQSVPLLSVGSTLLAGLTLNITGNDERIRKIIEEESSLLKYFVPVFAGGSLSTLSDFVITGFDILNGKIKDSDDHNEENYSYMFQNARNAYLPTTEATVALFDEDSLCVESIYEMILLFEISFHR